MTAKKTPAVETAARIFRANGGLMRSSEAFRAGIHRNVFYRMRDEGILAEVSRGLYRLADDYQQTHPDLAVVAAKVEKGVICLISALSFHEITTQIPHAIDVAIKPGVRPVVIDHPPVNYYWFDPQAHAAGVEEHVLDGRTVKIYSKEKTLADCFKYRNKIGLDTAIEALKFYAEQQRIIVSEIMKYAKLCRVANVMLPYLEAIV